MVNIYLSTRCQIGLDFFKFLSETDRASIKERIELRDIYNNEFRGRNEGTRYPNFGSVLYALKMCKKVTRRRDQITFNTTIRSHGCLICKHREVKRHYAHCCRLSENCGCRQCLLIQRQNGHESAQVRNLYVDQWHTPRNRQSQPVHNGAASPETIQAFSSADEAETGVRARRKLASLLINKLKVDRTQFISDKHGVTITGDCPFENGKLDLRVENTKECTVKLIVRNEGTQPVFFTYYTPLRWLKCLRMIDEHKVTKINPLEIKPGHEYEIQVNFRIESVGFYPATLAFEFKPDLQPSSKAFHIVRFIEAYFMTSLGLELAPVAPYKPRSLPAWTAEPEYQIVDGQRPEGYSVLQLKQVVELKQYRIPLYMNQLIKVLKQSGPSSDGRRAVLESPLCWENYTEKFQLLLYLEELQMAVDIRRYNIPNEDKEFAVLKRDPGNKKLLVLEVPGVSENRPSVLRGDAILVYPQGETGKKYRGYVHSVQLDRVKLGFASELLDRFIKGTDFSLIEGIKFNVEFTINRLTVRVQHRAAELATSYGLKSVLFPDAPPSSCQPLELPKLRLFDWQLEKNPEQYQAVQHIVAGSSRPAPYLVFGPPGTGKTVTLVEAIKQIEKTQASCHILACAPSNSAADLLCTKILDHVEGRKVYRMYASSRDLKYVPENLKAYSNLVGECYVFSPKDKLMEYKIMVTTLLTAGRFVSGGIPAGHFTHIFVDEAGHAVETECLVPLAGLLDTESGQLVLAGDPKQLGPILRSPYALKSGMGMSLLERLMNDFPMYHKRDDVFSNSFVTKLLRNYRSHPAILKIPNELFYGGELQACAEEYSRNFYCGWEHLPKRDFPVIFHGVTGVDEREASSPSFFNIAEVEELMSYVRKLLDTGGKKGQAKIAPKDIGIIAPYRKQVLKIRKALDKVGQEFKFHNMNTLKVGSVEEFQGQERRVIMVSTVRSNSDYVEIDKKFNLGFVKNEKRFNVAVTRAKALLIVVGNPRVLNTDTTWARFIQYCKEEGGLRHLDQTEEEPEMINRLAALSINIEIHVETAESSVQQFVDPEWRNEI